MILRKKHAFQGFLFGEQNMLADSLMTNFNFHLDMGTKIILLSELRKKRTFPPPMEHGTINGIVWTQNNGY